MEAYGNGSEREQYRQLYPPYRLEHFQYNFLIISTL